MSLVKRCIRRLGQQSRSMTNSKAESIWSRAFALLCLAEFLGYAQHAVLQPTFPLYITHLGCSPLVVGLVIASFGVTSVISRPILGYWADRWSVTGVMILGFVAQAASLSLCLIPFAGATMFANGLRGIGWSGMNTGAYTLLAISAPSERRGEAPRYFGSRPVGRDGAFTCRSTLGYRGAVWGIPRRFYPRYEPCARRRRRSLRSVARDPSCSSRLGFRVHQILVARNYQRL